MKQQLKPNHATHLEYVNQKNIDRLFDTNFMYLQPKFDGERMLLHFDNDKTYCTSRRISKKTNEFRELQDSLPTFQFSVPNYGYTVLDGEIYSKDWSTIAGITKSLPERAIELQKENEAKFAVFDCLFYDGEDIRNQPYHNRLHYAEKFVEKINKSFIDVVETIHVQSLENSNYATDRFNTKENGRKTSDTIVYYNGIDRIDNLKGYLKNNIVPCCKFCNTAKSSMSQTEFKEWINRVYENYFNIAKERIDNHKGRE